VQTEGGDSVRGCTRVFELLLAITFGPWVWSPDYGRWNGQKGTGYSHISALSHEAYERGSTFIQSLAMNDQIL
jgi:hypothetical protein